MIKKRKPFVALLLSLVPGLGQAYNGQLKKGLLFLAVDFIIPFLFGLFGLLNNFEGLLMLLVFSVLFIVYRMADGFIQARKLKTYELKPYNKWYFYLLFIVSISFVRIFLDFPASTGMKAFSIPTISMNPTLQPGDRVIADLKYYNSNKIEQGDIVIFNSPGGEIWVFRVIGLPNDSIEIKEGIVYLNSQHSESKLANEYVLDRQEVVQYKEQLNPSKSIKILKFKDPSMTYTQTVDKMVVPEGQYFLMGDNRDNAYDSRFIGPIKREEIIGRVIYSYWGKDSDRINIDFINE